MSPSGLIDAWRQRVPSRLDRDDPFAEDGFESRPATRLVRHTLSLSLNLITNSCRHIARLSPRHVVLRPV